jgi:hypothetical protein
MPSQLPELSFEEGADNKMEYNEQNELFPKDKK